MTDLQEYDVWCGLVNGRQAYRAVPATTPVEAAQSPLCGMRHLDRVEAVNRKQAISHAVRLIRLHWKTNE